MKTLNLEKELNDMLITLNSLSTQLKIKEKGYVWILNDKNKINCSLYNIQKNKNVITHQKV
jgi:hypothetical protein